MAINLKSLLKKTHLLHPNEIEDKTCPICYEDYLHHPSQEFPRALPCGHVVGTECLLLWVSSQSHEESIQCPWCRREIIRSVDKEGMGAVVLRYTEMAFIYVETLISIADNAADRALSENKCALLALVFLLALPALYFDNRYAKLPFRLLSIVVGNVLMRRLKPHPRYGIVLMFLGLCVGIFFNRIVGRVLFRMGSAPFIDVIQRAFVGRFWLCLGTGFGVLLLRRVPRVPGLRVVAGEVAMQAIGTLWHLGFLMDFVEME